MPKVVTNDVLSTSITHTQVTISGDQVFTVGTCPLPIKSGGIYGITPLGYSYTRQVYVAPVAAVVSLAWTTANSTTYAFNITQEINGTLVSYPFSYTSDAVTSGQEGRIAAAINNVFEKLHGSGALKVTTNDATTSPIVFTADSDYPKFTLTDVSNVTSTVSTPGVAEVNNGTQLLAQGVTNAIAGTHYTTYTVEWAQPTAGINTAEGLQKRLHILCLSEAASQYTDVDDELSYAFGSGIYH